MGPHPPMYLGRKMSLKVMQFLSRIIASQKKDRTASPPAHCLGGRPTKKRCFAFLRGTTLNHSLESDDPCSGTGQILSTTSGQAAKYTPRLCSSTRETSLFSRDLIFSGKIF